jgi:hypothetical protein
MEIYSSLSMVAYVRIRGILPTTRRSKGQLMPVSDVGVDLQFKYRGEETLLAKQISFRENIKVDGGRRVTTMSLMWMIAT